MKKLLFFILGFMVMALSGCQSNNVTENMPEGILSIQFKKTAFSINEDINATIYIGMEDGYENYVEENYLNENHRPTLNIQLRVTNDGRVYGDVSGYVLKDLTLDPLLYDYSLDKDEEPIFNYSEVYTLPSELFVNNEGNFYIFLYIEIKGGGLVKYIPYEFSYSIIDEQINIVKVKDGRYN